MKRLFLKLIAGLTIASSLGAPLGALAQISLSPTAGLVGESGIDWGAPPSDTSFNLNPTSIATDNATIPDNYLFQPFGVNDLGEPQDPEQALQRERQEDQKRCEEELGFSSLLNKAGSLPNIIGQGLTQKLPNTLSRFMSERMPQLLQQQLASTLPNLLQVGLGNALPGYVNNAIADLVAGGVSSQAIGQALPNIINRGVMDLTPRILERDLPNAIDQSVRNNLPGYFGSQFKDQVPALIRNNPEFVARVQELVKTVASQAGQAAHDANNQIDAIPLTSVFLDHVNGNVSQSQQDLIASGVLDGVANTAADSVANDPNLQNISRTLGPIIAKIMSQQIIPQLMSTFRGGLTEAGGSFGRVDTTVNGLLGRGYDFSRGISGDFFNPIVGEIAPELGNWANTVGSDFSSTLSSSFRYNVPLTQVASFESIGSNTLGNVELTPEAMSILGDGNIDMSSLNQNLGNVSTNVGSAVNTSASSIGNNSVFSQAGLNKLGDGLKGGLASGVGGLVGNLTGNIPYVGGLLAPITEQLTTGLLSGLLGVNTIGVMAVFDTGAQQNQAAGFKETIKNTSQTAQNTKTSNQNEQQLQKTTDKALEIAIQNCTHNKALERMAAKQEQARFVLDREARKKAWTYYTSAFDNWLKAAGHGYNVSGVPGAAQGQNGQPLIADPSENAARARNEGVAQAETSIAQSGGNGLYAQSTIGSIKQAIAKAGQPAQTNLTQAELDTLSDPANTDTNTFRANYLKYIEPDNNPLGALSRNYQLAANLSSAAETESALRFVAYQGYNENRYCDAWQPKTALNIPNTSNLNVEDITQYQQGEFNELTDQCLRWVTVTPGSTNKDIASSFVNAPNNFLANTHTVGEDFVTQVASQPTAAATNLRQAMGQGLGDAGQNSQSLCPGPGPCEDTGYTIGQSNSAVSQAIAQSISSLANLNAGRSSGSSNGGSLGNFAGGLLDLLGNLNFNLPPANQTSPTANFEMSFEKTDTGVQWSAPDAYYCSPKNDWAGSGNQIKKDAVLDNVGTQTVDLAASPAPYQLACYDYSGQTSQIMSVQF